jgi:hypothetical protein
MKKQTQHNICWAQVGILATVLIFSMLGRSEATEKRQRSFIDSKSSLGKLVGQVTQTNGKGIAGNGFVIGASGCYVLTNVHVAFGEAKDSTSGQITLLDNASAGHELLFQFDFDSKNQKFKRKVKATVVEFGNYTPETNRGRIQDVALLKLSDCLGPEYGGLEFDHSSLTKRVPDGELMTVGFGSLNGTSGIIAEQGCESFSETPISGLIFTNCRTTSGMSGMMVLGKSKLDGKFKLVAIHDGVEALSDGTVVSTAIFAKALNRFLGPALGDAPIDIGPVAADRKPALRWPVPGRFSSTTMPATSLPRRRTAGRRCTSAARRKPSGNFSRRVGCPEAPAPAPAAGLS